MSTELILTFFKNVLPNIHKFVKYTTSTTIFYIKFLLYITYKVNIAKNFFWKVSNFSDLYWFLYVEKNIKTLSYISNK